MFPEVNKLEIFLSDSTTAMNLQYSAFSTEYFQKYNLDRTITEWL
jgi:hypothetical protein